MNTCIKMHVFWSQGQFLHCPIESVKKGGDWSSLPTALSQTEETSLDRLRLNRRGWKSNVIIPKDPLEHQHIWRQSPFGNPGFRNKSGVSNGMKRMSTCPVIKSLGVNCQQEIWTVFKCCQNNAEGFSWSDSKDLPQIGNEMSPMPWLLAPQEMSRVANYLRLCQPIHNHGLLLPYQCWLLPCIHHSPCWHQSLHHPWCKIVQKRTQRVLSQ